MVYTVLHFLALCCTETQYTTISYLSVQQSKLSPLGAVDDPMNCFPRPKAEGNSSSGHPQHRGGDNLTVAQKDLK